MMRSNTRIIGYLYHLYQININQIASAEEIEREAGGRGGGWNIINIIGCRTSSTIAITRLRHETMPSTLT